MTDKAHRGRERPPRSGRDGSKGPAGSVSDGKVAAQSGRDSRPGGGPGGRAVINRSDAARECIEPGNLAIRVTPRVGARDRPTEHEGRRWGPAVRSRWCPSLPRLGRKSDGKPDPSPQMSQTTGNDR